MLKFERLDGIRLCLVHFLNTRLCLTYSNHLITYQYKKRENKNGCQNPGVKR